MSEEIAPYGLVHVGAFFTLERTAAWCDRTMSMTRISLHVKVGDEPPGVSVGSLSFINIDDGAELMKAQQLPGTLVVELVPAHIFDVAESKESVLGGGRGKCLPGLVLITRSAECDNACDFGMFGESGGSGGTVRCSGEDDFSPVEITFVLIEKLLPFPAGIGFGEVLY